MIDLDMVQDDVTTTFVDNPVVITISNNSVFHGKLEHLKIKYYLVEEVQENDEVKHFKTKAHFVDILIKELSKSRDISCLRNKLVFATKIVRSDDDDDDDIFIGVVRLCFVRNIVLFV